MNHRSGIFIAVNLMSAAHGCSSIMYPRQILHSFFKTDFGTQNLQLMFFPIDGQCLTLNFYTRFKPSSKAVNFCFDIEINYLQQTNYNYYIYSYFSLSAILPIWNFVVFYLFQYWKAYTRENLQSITKMIWNFHCNRIDI